MSMIKPRGQIATLPCNVRCSSQPNDRRYDRKIEQLVRRMSAEELDAILNDLDADDE
jgi:hypothetical protein